MPTSIPRVGGSTLTWATWPNPTSRSRSAYDTARSLFVQGDVQAVLQAFLGGRIKVDGDLSKLLDPRSGIWPGGPSAPAPPGPAVAPQGLAGGGAPGPGPANQSGAAGAPWVSKVSASVGRRR